MITVVKPDFYWPETTIAMFPYLMEHIERCGRICYKSEDFMTKDSAERFVKRICRSGHHSVLEHFSITAIVICSRACSHQLVRHRIAAYSQESQRYCNYGKKDSLQVICPFGLEPGDYDYQDHIVHRDGTDWIESDTLSVSEVHWLEQIESAYREYKAELATTRPEDARYVLPNATKTELAVTYNVRQWKHFFKMRCASMAQWEIRGIANSVQDDLKSRFPSVFGEEA